MLKALFMNDVQTVERICKEKPLDRSPSTLHAYFRVAVEYKAWNCFRYFVEEQHADIHNYNDYAFHAILAIQDMDMLKYLVEYERANAVAAEITGTTIETRSNNEYPTDQLFASRDVYSKPKKEWYMNAIQRTSVEKHIQETDRMITCMTYLSSIAMRRAYPISNRIPNISLFQCAHPISDRIPNQHKNNKNNKNNKNKRKTTSVKIICLPLFIYKAIIIRTLHCQLYKLSTI